MHAIVAFVHTASDDLTMAAWRSGEKADEPVENKRAVRSNGSAQRVDCTTNQCHLNCPRWWDADIIAWADDLCELRVHQLRRGRGLESVSSATIRHSAWSAPTMRSGRIAALVQMSWWRQWKENARPGVPRALT